MKAAAFDYVKPRSLDQVLSLLQEHGDDARLLAGGQTLMATLNMRLSEPRLVIDITGIEALRGISVQGNVLRIGALATHSEIEHSPLVARHAPLLKAAAPHIAHRAIRNSGTWGGSIAYADPAAEWPTCLLALGGTVVARGPDGERRIAADDFFQGLYATALEQGYTLASLINDAPINQWDPAKGPMWQPKNSPAIYEGPTTLRLGLAKSKNVMSVRLMRAIGLDTYIDGLTRFGFAREHQERLQALGQAQLRWQEALSEYSSLMAKTSQDAYARFESKLAEREEPGRQLGSGQKNGPTAGTKRNTHIKTNTLCY